MNPFSPTRNFVMHQPVTALTVRILILLLLAVPLVLLCRKAADFLGLTFELIINDTRLL